MTVCKWVSMVRRLPLLVSTPGTTWQYVRMRLLRATGIDLSVPFRLDKVRKEVARLEEQFTNPASQVQAIPFGNYMLVPDLMSSTPVVYSAGVGRNVEFEQALLSRYPEAELVLCDPTPLSERFLETHVVGGHARFYPVALSGNDGTIELYSDSKIHDSVGDSHSFSIYARGADKVTTLAVEAVRLSSLMRKVGHDHIDVLKLDIEGSAPVVLLDMLKSDIYPPQVVFEIEMPPRDVVEVADFVRETAELLGQFQKLGYSLWNVRTEAHKRGRALEVLAIRTRI